MANTICLVGENLRSVYELYFNDQKAILHTSYITDHTLMVDVPKEIPSVVTDKIYMGDQSKRYHDCSCCVGSGSYRELHFL